MYFVINHLIDMLQVLWMNTSKRAVQGRETCGQPKQRRIRVLGQLKRKEDLTTNCNHFCLTFTLYAQAAPFWALYFGKLAAGSDTVKCRSCVCMKLSKRGRRDVEWQKIRNKIWLWWDPYMQEIMWAT